MAEKKTTKKNTKVEKTQSSVKCDCNCGENKGILEKIFCSLIIIIVILALMLVTIIVKGTNISTKTTTTDTTETEQKEEGSGEYDVSMFDTLKTSAAIDRIKKGNRELVYIGRSTCGYCVKFLPNLQKAQKEYDYKTIYINLEEMTSDDQEAILKVDNDDGYIKENLGYTPMMLVFEDGKLKEGTVGYTEYNEFAKFLEKNGYEK